MALVVSVDSVANLNHLLECGHVLFFIPEQPLDPGLENLLLFVESADDPPSQVAQPIKHANFLGLIVLNVVLADQLFQSLESRSDISQRFVHQVVVGE